MQTRPSFPRPGLDDILCCFAIALLLGVTPDAHAQSRIIDMHVHSYSDTDFVDSPEVVDYWGTPGATSAEAHRVATFDAFKKLKIVKAVISGRPESVETWASKGDNRNIIRGVLMYSPNDHGMDTITFERLVNEQKIEVFGELAPYYAGKTLNDLEWQPYLRICQKYDIPVALHTGGGDPGGTYSWAPKARLAVGDPYLIEDILVKYPKLRIYLMHSGEEWYEHALRLMAYYPQLYSDLGALLWVERLDQRYATEFLKAAKQAGYLHKVMFGSDQMRWPYAIEKSINFLNSLDFLSKQDKEDILYNNAATFLRLSNP
jgi:predicted TIM-barrel fold metal-dependent hydrolase